MHQRSHLVSESSRSGPSGLSLRRPTLSALDILVAMVECSISEQPFVQRTSCKSLTGDRKSRFGKNPEPIARILQLFLSTIPVFHEGLAHVRQGHPVDVKHPRLDLFFYFQHFFQISISLLFYPWKGGPAAKIHAIGTQLNYLLQITIGKFTTPNRNIHHRVPPNSITTWPVGYLRN